MCVIIEIAIKKTAKYMVVSGSKGGEVWNPLRGRF